MNLKDVFRKPLYTLITIIIVITLLILCRSCIANSNDNYEIEVLKETHYINIHNKLYSSKGLIYRESNLTNYPSIVKELFKIEGIENINLVGYEIIVKIGKIFNLEEVKKQIGDVLNEYYKKKSINLEASCIINTKINESEDTKYVELNRYVEPIDNKHYFHCAKILERDNNDYLCLKLKTCENVIIHKSAVIPLSSDMGI